MPNNILSPLEENFATKFYFGISINEYTFNQLIAEFHLEGYEKNKSQSYQLSNNFQLKMINKKEKKAIEISSNSISFFPVVQDENEIEEIRKKIFKHVAKKYEVYNITSKENLTSSITSLLKNDLRSCASLLYYSFHKFTNTLLYNYYNKNLGKTDNEIIFDEIEHYTSFMFYKFTEEVKKGNNIDLNDSAEVMTQLTHHSGKSNIDPFMLLKCTWKMDEKTMVFLMPNIVFLSNYLFKIDYSAEKSLDEYKNILEKLSNEKANQEVNVKKAIAYSLIKSLENDDEKEIWMMYIIALRLYWLRQTADYEFDFDVKTSVKEMAKMVHSIKSLIEYKQVEPKTKFNKINPINNPQIKEEPDEESESKDKVITCPLYSVDYVFPKKLLIEEREKAVTLFMSVLHLDSEFDKDKILEALNYTPHITNQKDCFIYEVSNKDLSVFLYINFSSEGRWLFWFQNDMLEINTYSEKDLKNAFKDFFTSLSEGYRDFHGVKLDTNLVGTNPMHLNESFSLIEISGLNLMEFELTKRRLQYKQSLKNIFDNLFLLNDDLQLFGALNFDFDIHFGFKFNIPFDERLSKILTNKVPMLYLNFIIVNSSEIKHEEINLFINSFNDDSSFLNFRNIVLDSNELQDFLLTGESSKIISVVINSVNNICYSEISRNSNQIEDVNFILEKCVELDSTNSLPYATLGYWYFHIKGDLTNGKRYYEESIRVDAEYNAGEYVSQLEQKYYFELAKYYCENEVDKNQALYYISEGLDKDTRFQEEFNELIMKHDIEVFENKLIAASEVDDEDVENGEGTDKEE